MALIDQSNWPRRYVTPRHEWIVGLDVGQAVDPSAVCALEHIVKGTGNMLADERNKELRQERVESFHVRHLERLPLGTPYPDQIQHVANLLGREPLVGAKLVIDFTGVGRPIFDSFKRAGLAPHGVLITGGNQVASSAKIHHVPKQTLVSQLESRLHSGELKIAANIADAGALAEELKDFSRKVSESGRVTFNARSGSHDDLVLSVAIALFLALGMPRTSHEPFPFQAMRDEALWAAVIGQALTDANTRVTDLAPGMSSARVSELEGKQRDRQEARIWFIEVGRDFDAVCSLAGLNPERIRAFAMERMCCASCCADLPGVPGNR